jgi:hypothetical protein
VNRIASSLLALAGAAALGGCNLDLDLFDDTCIIGPCYSGGGGGYETYVVGFPYRRVDRSTTAAGDGYAGRLVVGDTFTLQLVAGRDPSLPDVDTVQVHRWTVTDTAVAEIASRPGGAGHFTAKAPGTVQVVTDGKYAQVWACEAGGCSRVSEIFITP